MNEVDEKFNELTAAVSKASSSRKNITKDIKVEMEFIV